MKMNMINKVIHWIMSFLTMAFILFSSIRLLITPIFLEWEYNKPSFPEDKYGFTIEDRLFYARYAVNYLINNEDITYLSNLKFDNGEQLFNDRELSHMLDVKVLVKLMHKIWIITTIIIVSYLIFLITKKNFHEIFFILERSSYLTFGFIGFIIVSLSISFSALFTGFHKIFFEDDTWIFLYSDSLIRLFPMKFWQDAFISIGIISIIFSILFIGTSRIYKMKTKIS